MKYPYELARRLRSNTSRDPLGMDHSEIAACFQLMTEAAGTLELMAELLTLPERAPAPNDLLRPERRCKCGLHPMGHAFFIAAGGRNHSMDYCR